MKTPTETSRRILLVNDMAGWGKVALSAMIPILSHLRHQIFNLPTALVSNTLDCGTFEILETTDYLKGAIAAWDKLGFTFDAVCTGFLVSAEQTCLVRDFCRAQRKRGVDIFVDPIMGDEGVLYNGVGPDTVGYMREMCAVAQIIMPNYTEAAFLAGTDPTLASVSEAQARELTSRLHELGAASVVVTSCPFEGGHATLVSESADAELTVLPYDEVPVRFPGTGDIFSAVLVGDVLSGRALVDATQHAMDVVRDLLVLNEGREDTYRGIPIELYLDRI